MTYWHAIRSGTRFVMKNLNLKPSNMRTIKAKFGNHRSTDVVTLSANSITCRPKEQVAAFMDLVENDKDIVFFCNPTTIFAKEFPKERYNSTITLSYYKKDGHMWVTIIFPSGKVGNAVRVSHPDMSRYGMVNKTEQEFINELVPAIEMNKQLKITNY